MTATSSTNINIKPTCINFSNTHSHDASLFIRVKSSGACLFVKILDIIMVEAESNYSNIYLQSGKKIMTSKTLKYWQNMVNNDKMIRIHNSNLIHKAAIKYFRAQDKTVVLTNGMEVKCSRRRHQSLKSAESYCHLCKSI